MNEPLKNKLKLCSDEYAIMLQNLKKDIIWAQIYLSITLPTSCVGIYTFTKTSNDENKLFALIGIACGIVVSLYCAHFLQKSIIEKNIINTSKKFIDKKIEDLELKEEKVKKVKFKL